MGLLGVDHLIALQILPGFFSNCLFLVVYDSVVLIKQAVGLLSGCSPASGESGGRRMLTMVGLRMVWRGFLLDALKRVKLGGEAPDAEVVRVNGGPEEETMGVGRAYCRLLDLASPGRPLVVNFGSAT